MIWPFKRRKTWKEHFDRGMSSGRMGDLNKAVRHFQKATELAPGEPYPHYELGYTLFLQGRYEEALAELHMTNEISPGFFLVQTEIFLCKAVLSGELDSNGLSKLRLLQRMTDTGQGQSSEAVALCSEVIEVAPGCALGHYFLGKALFNKDPDGSELALQRCLELGPDDTTAINALSHLGLHREASGDLQAARAIWADVLAQYQGNPHLKMTEMILNQRGSA